MFTIISKGGPVMYPLLLCSVTALAVIVERIIFFVRLRKTENGLSDRLRAARKLIAAGATNEAVLLFNDSDGPVMRVLSNGLAAANPENAELEMQAAASLERKKLFSGLSILDTIVTAAPLLGLLGTVTGILNTFRLLGAASAMGRMESVGLGIAEALITTASGLIIAIPTLVAMNYFVHRAESVAEMLERETIDFSAMLKDRRGNHGSILEA
ncbi:MAG TPA: hypothetical protein DF292_03615 [Firmicutes bacterium]|nr:hypothetical protein [Bacillota bacterium]HCT36106.1 hypothetical protein [Bacillota bacterium]